MLAHRNQRIAELSTTERASVFNQVYPLQKPDYAKDVTEASNKAFVFVHLTSSLGTNRDSGLLTELWREMARTFGDIKFCEIKANLCIENYPERNSPTILVYRDGEIRKQIITLKELGGSRTSIKGTHAIYAGQLLTREEAKYLISNLRPRESSDYYRRYQSQ